MVSPELSLVSLFNRASTDQNKTPSCLDVKKIALTPLSPTLHDLPQKKHHPIVSEWSYCL
jgi:hypothetical protein